mmetsp:Transcript_10716/g.19920  ORF Transcript_10716/g.19920 Transcript_10716/m.19920 type:complete len:564 (+) Transcript_10716:58-1749(+)
MTTQPGFHLVTDGVEPSTAVEGGVGPGLDDVSLHSETPHESRDESHNLLKRDGAYHVGEFLSELSPPSSEEETDESKIHWWQRPARFKARICKAYGHDFFWLVFCQYGLSQGAGVACRILAADVMFKNLGDVSPFTMRSIDAMAHIPWTIKPIYGILSDTLPIAGLRRTYYIVGSCVLGIVSQTGLALSGDSISAFSIGLTFFLGGLSCAVPDVMVDALIAERSRKQPKLAPDLQTLCWISLGCCTLVVSLLKGPVEEIYGPQFLLFLAALGPFAVLIFTCVGSFKDEPDPPSLQGTPFAQRLKTQCLLLWASLRLPEVFRPTAFIFLRIALVPSLHEVMLLFYTSPKEGYPNLHPEYLEFTTLIGSLCGIFAIASYNRWLTEAPLRLIFVAFGLLSLLSGMWNLVLVTRLNVKLGISDENLLFGDEVLFATLGTALGMPLQVLMVRLCPPTVEAAFFGLLASLNNTGYDVSAFLGTWIIDASGVTKEDLSGLWKVVMVKQVFKLVCLVLPIFLLPEASPLSYEFVPRDLPSSRRSRPQNEDEDLASSHLPSFREETPRVDGI